ncbi:hypothetical protein BDR04DRAFT_1119968 [Suillus decipiens]|nr:hypothetical protein BDR04DRAFT_1119968 [Suillus decipiens]
MSQLASTVLRKKMETDQAAACVDAPKPTRPCPCPVKKAVKVMQTSNLTMAKDKAISANGNGSGARGKLAAGANIDHPRSDAEEEVSTSGPQKFGFAVEHIPGWRMEVPAASVGSKLSSKTLRKRPSTMPSDFSSTAPSSKLTIGSTISSSGTPLMPINTITDAGADNMADHFMTMFADNNLAESVEHSQALATAALAQTPTSHSTILAMSVKCKLADMEDGLTNDDMIEDALPEDDLLKDDLLKDDMIEDDQIRDDFMVDDDFVIEEDTPSSDVEFVGHRKPVVVKTKSEPVSLQVTSAVTNVGVKHKAPVAKWTKSSITHTRSLSSISSATSGAMSNSVEVEILPCSAYRIKNLPGGAQAVARWSAVFIPTLIFGIGDQDEVWACALPKLEAALCTTVQDTWDMVYKDILHKVTTDGPVMALVSHPAAIRMVQWHGHYCYHCAHTLHVITG